VPERRRLAQRASSRGFLLCLAVLGCSRGTEGRPREQKTVAASAQADSLVLTTATGAEVWFTLLRPASNKNGQKCVERGLEIRHHGKRTRVPLLYTGAAPELLNDTIMRAKLWKDCAPGVPYLVSLRTGQPVPEPRANQQ
jgi:hypothetical protein